MKKKLIILLAALIMFISSCSCQDCSDSKLVFIIKGIVSDFTEMFEEYD